RALLRDLAGVHALEARDHLFDPLGPLEDLRLRLADDVALHDRALHGARVAPDLLAVLEEDVQLVLVDLGVGAGQVPLVAESGDDPEAALLPTSAAQQERHPTGAGRLGQGPFP